MRDLLIEATKSTFRCALGAGGRLEISGSSYPENAVEFFEPVLAWVRELLAGRPADVSLVLRVDYMNTSSTKRLLDVLDLLDGFHREGGSARVSWRFESGDDDMREMGEDLAHGLALPFTFEPVERGPAT